MTKLARASAALVLLAGALLLANGRVFGDTAGSRTSWGPEDGLTVGSFMPLSGVIAVYGQSSNRGMGMAVEEINAKGGVLDGRKLHLVVEDSQGKPESSINAAIRLMDGKGAKILVGEVASSCSLAVAPICQQRGIPMLTPGSTHPAVTAKGDFVFRSCFDDDQQAAFIAKFALSKGYRKGVVLRDTESDYSKGLDTVITERFTAGGGKILASLGYTQKQHGFSVILTEVKEKQPDVVFIPGYYEQAGLIIKAAREQGITAAMVGGDGWDSPVLSLIAGACLDQDCYFINHFSKDDPRPKVQDFFKGFKERYEEDPDALAACAYDAIYLVADAIGRAGSFKPPALRDALAQTREFEGVTGRIALDAQRNALKPCVVLGFKGGRQFLATTLSPSDLP
jgi:branched-chain amino acid transport system substrate-binding protein